MSAPKSASYVLATASKEALDAIRAAGLAETGTALELFTALADRDVRPKGLPVRFMTEYACMHGELDLLRCLHTRWGHLPSPANACTAAMGGHTHILDYLADECGLTIDDLRVADDCTTKLACGSRMITLAATYGNVNVLAWLLARGMTAEDARATENLALNRAASSHQADVVRHLFEEWGLGKADAAQIASDVAGSPENEYGPAVKSYVAERFGMTLAKMPVVYCE